MKMIDNAVKEQIRELTSIEKLFTDARLGDDIYEGGELVCGCPHCGAPDHCCVNEEKKVYHCFKCGAGGDLFMAYQAIHCCGFLAAMEALGAGIGLDLVEGNGHEGEGRAAHLVALAKSYVPSEQELMALGLQVSRVCRTVIGSDPDRLPQVWTVMRRVWMELTRRKPRKENLSHALAEMREHYRQAVASQNEQERALAEATKW
jgi:hypothetical protein